MIPLVKSTFYRERETKRRLARFIEKAERLSFGKECLAFEKNFAKFQGRRDAVFVTSGSAANLALVQALLNLGVLKHGDRVGFSALTWATNPMPIIQSGLVPVPVDVELDTLNVSSAALKKVHERRPLKALFLTDVLGLCDDIGAIAAYCRKNRIVLLEDACEALGSVCRGRKLGNFGLAATFSFYVAHQMSTVEGGAVATDDRRLATMLRLVRAHGWDRNLPEREQRALRHHAGVASDFYGKYLFYDLAYNVRPTEVQGFLGNDQLRFLPEVIARRAKNFARMAAAVNARPRRFYPLRVSFMDTVSSFSMPVVCRSAALRDTLLRRLASVAETRPVIAGDITRQPFFRKYAGKDSLPKLPNARLVHERGFYVANNPELTPHEVGTLIYELTRE